MGIVLLVFIVALIVWFFLKQQSQQLQQQIELKRQHQLEANHRVSFHTESMFLGLSNAPVHFEVCDGCGARFFTLPNPPNNRFF